jgi:hypothetical protein
MHDLEADQIVPTDDERKLDVRCLFAKAGSDRRPLAGRHDGWPAGRSTILI